MGTFSYWMVYQVLLKLVLVYRSLSMASKFLYGYIENGPYMTLSKECSTVSDTPNKHGCQEEVVFPYHIMRKLKTSYCQKPFA